MTNLGHVFRTLRNNRGWTLRFAANKLAISHVHLCNIEKGRAKPSLQLLSRVGDIYGSNAVEQICQTISSSPF